MLEFLQGFLSGNFEPHGYCLLWQPGLLATHIISDALIALSYFSIPLALAAFLRKRPDVAFGAIGWLFVVFITACGLTHVMNIWNIYHGDYGLEGIVKAVTAIASVPTAMILWPLIPRAIAIPSPTQLQRANRELEGLVTERDNALAKLTRESANRERAEAALVQAQKIDAVGQLTGGIAHDFNNLLQALAGNLELIRRQPAATDKVERWAANALRSIERGTRLTGQLLAFSRTQRLELQALDVNRLVSGVTELIQRSLGPSIELKTVLAAEPCPAQADPTQLELAILNLAINARDAMPGGGSLILSTRRVTHGGDGELTAGDYVEIGVSDSGTGMTPEIAARALEPFFTTKPIGQGTGLGLSMAYGVARQSGGTLTIASAPGEGTSVRILLPVTAEAALAPDNDDELSDPDGPMPAKRPGIRLMLVDDDHEVRGSLTDTLEGLGYEAQALASPFAALAALEHGAPDLLILDFAMPEMNGAEFARQARALHPMLPIIFVSGYSDSAAIDQVRDEHSLVLKKPFRLDDLATLIAART